MTATFPGLNFVRVGIHHPYPDPSSFQGFVTQMTGRGIVVEFEDHPDGGGGQDPAYTGSALASELAWYASMAKTYVANPYVWFGTFNEPGTQGGSVSGWELATYNAIRGAGNNNPILLEIVGWPGAWNNAMTPSDFAGMHNTIWDPHFYGWVARYATDQATVDQALADEIAAVQQIPSADGKMPVIIAEYGNSTDGSTIDPNGAQVVTSVANAGGSGKAGSAAWAWLPGGNADHLQNGGTLTSPYGQQVALYIGITTQSCTAAEATANANNEIAAVTAAVAATPPANAAPASTQPATSSLAGIGPHDRCAESGSRCLDRPGQRDHQCRAGADAASPGNHPVRKRIAIGIAAVVIAIGAWTVLASRLFVWMAGLSAYFPSPWVTWWRYAETASRSMGRRCCI